MNKENLLEFLKKNGKGTYTWFELAEKFKVGVGLPRDKRIKKTNDIYRAYIKKSKTQSFHKQELTNDYAEFLKWKMSKETYTEPLNKSLPKPFLKGDINNVIIIGDTHLPFELEGYLEFCREQQEKYNCGTVVHIGDFLDNHACSFHDHDPEGQSIGDEYKLALVKAKEWYKVFPEVKMCIGNHDALPFRKSFTAGLPSHWLKSYQEMFESPKEWEWDFIHRVNGVIYQHGTGLSGEMASINAARENRESTVTGHLHTVMNSRFLASHKDLIFGVSVGCGIDHTKYAFAYGRENTRKPVIACCVVLNGKLPINIPFSL